MDDPHTSTRFLRSCEWQSGAARVLITAAFNNYCWQKRRGATSLLLYDSMRNFWWIMMNTKITGTCWDINVHFSINGWPSRLWSAPPIFGRFYLPFPIIQAPSGWCCPRLQKAKCWLKHFPWSLAVPTPSHFDTNEPTKCSTSLLRTCSPTGIVWDIASIALCTLNLRGKGERSKGRRGLEQEKRARERGISAADGRGWSWGGYRKKSSGLRLEGGYQKGRFQGGGTRHTHRHTDIYIYI